VQSHGQFDHAEAGAEMTANLGNRFDQVGAQFIGDRLEIILGNRAQIGRNGDLRQQRVADGVDHCPSRQFKP
jgi:hypothetical protein